MKMLFVGVFDARSTNVSQAFAFERAGVEVVRYNFRQKGTELGNHARDRDIVAVCRQEQPDLVFFSKCNEVSVDVVHQCNEFSTTVLWYMDPLNYNFHTRLIQKICACTFTVCALREPFHEAMKYGPHVFFLQEGFDPDADHPVDVPFKHDVSFIGHLRGERRRYQRAIGFHVYTNSYGRDHAVAVAESRINLNFTEGGTSDRTYKVLAARGFLLTQPWPDMEEDFEVGRDLDVFTSIPDLRAKVAFYLSHLERREAIAVHGHQTVQKLSRHHFARRVIEIYARQRRARG